MYASMGSNAAHAAGLDLDPTFWPSAPAIRPHLRREVTALARHAHGWSLPAVMACPTGGVNGPIMAGRGRGTVRAGWSLPRACRRILRRWNGKGTLKTGQGADAYLPLLASGVSHSGRGCIAPRLCRRRPRSPSQVRPLGRAARAKPAAAPAMPSPHSGYGGDGGERAGDLAQSSFVGPEGLSIENGAPQGRVSFDSELLLSRPRAIQFSPRGLVSLEAHETFPGEARVSSFRHDRGFQSGGSVQGIPGP